MRGADAEARFRCDAERDGVVAPRGAGTAIGAAAADRCLDEPRRGVARGRARVAAIQERLEQLGWRQGQDLLVDIRWGSEDPDLERKAAAELAALAPDVVLVSGTLGVTAMLSGANHSSCVRGRRRSRWPRRRRLAGPPGRHATGFMAFEYTFAAKLLELLKQIAPGVKRAAVLRDASAPQGIANFAVIQSMAASIGVEVSPVDILDLGDIERAAAAFAGSADGGLVVTASGVAIEHNGFIVKLAARYRLPAVYAYRRIVVDGGLVLLRTRLDRPVPPRRRYVDPYFAGREARRHPARAGAEKV